MMLHPDMHDLGMLDADLVGEAYGDAMVAAWKAAEGPAAPAAPAAAASPVLSAISGGDHDENHLTDLEFYARHPERGGARIDKSDKALVKEWLSIRDGIVRPALARAGAPSRPTGSATFAPAPGSNAAAAEQATADTKMNRIIGLSLGGVALFACGVAALKR